MNDLIVAPRAEREVVRAFRWYLARSPRAARTFLFRLNDVYRRISEDPLHHPRFLGEYRFQKVVKYPYIVVFRIDRATPTVVAVNHTSRSNRFWKRRLQ
jgi:plasmid stabilization system protein ParE